jgi:hypothetical protein
VKARLEKSFQELSGDLPANVGVAIASGSRRPVCFGSWSSGVAWSTSKVPLAVAAMRAGSASRDQIFATIARSDNAAAERLWSRLGDPAAQLVESVIREAGDLTTVVESRRLRAEYTPFGQTRWSLADQARFAAGLSRVPDATEIIELMRNLSTEHQWGMAAKGFAAKGGWGPADGGDYLVRQLAIVSGTVGVALAAEVGNGGYQAGVDIINSLADWVADEALAEY